ncbi:MAG: TolC family protein [Pseudanabaenaceae cyanobacterium bins.39]|nr:TolC family protein [Pseudanabaenaceae cyanobacterium bins.39]
MGTSSSWLMLGAILSLLIPAWTANAQELSIAVNSTNKSEQETSNNLERQLGQNRAQELGQDTTKSASGKLPSASVSVDNAIEIGNAVRSGSNRLVADNVSPNQTVAPPVISRILPRGNDQVSKPVNPVHQVISEIAATVKNMAGVTSKPESVVPTKPTPNQPKVIASSTTPAIVNPESTVSENGKLNPEQTLVVPTTPSQVKLEKVKAVTLQEILDLLESNNPDVIQSRLGVERARASLQEAQAGRSPTITGSLQYSYNDSAQTRLSNINNRLSNNTTSNPLSGTVGINYNIFDSGVNDNSIRAAENSLRIAEATLSQAKQSVRLSIVTSYYNLQNADETIRIRADAVKSAQKSLDDSQARERAGVGTKFDVLQAEVQLANARQELFNAEAAQLVARRDLARLINYPATIEITAADKAEPVKPWDLPLEETILLAVRNRAELDIRRLEREVARDRANTSLARTGPQVSLFANVNTASEFTSGNGIGTGYQLGARLDWNLYDGGRSAAQVNQFKVDQAIAETQFEQAARQARFDVESAYINQRSRLQQIETATKALEQAKEALRLARLRLEAGVGTQLEVITAESDLTRADVNRIQAIIGYNQSRANLERAVSGL